MSSWKEMANDAAWLKGQIDRSIGVLKSDDELSEKGRSELAKANETAQKLKVELAAVQNNAVPAHDPNTPAATATAPTAAASTAATTATATTTTEGEKVTTPTSHSTQPGSYEDWQEWAKKKAHEATDSAKASYHKMTDES